MGFHLCANDGEGLRKKPGDSFIIAFWVHDHKICKNQLWRYPWSEYATHRAPPDTFMSATPGQRFSTTCMPDTRAEPSLCASTIPISNDRPKRTSTRCWTTFGG